MKLLFLAAALVSSTLATSAIAQSNLIILTGSTSGVYYPLGSALSGIFMKSVPGLRASVQVTQGSVENLRLLHAGDGELAFSLGDAVSAAWKGSSEAGFPAPLSHLRGVEKHYVALFESAPGLLAQQQNLSFDLAAWEAGRETLDRLAELEQNLALFFTGFSRGSPDGSAT